MGQIQDKLTRPSRIAPAEQARRNPFLSNAHNLPLDTVAMATRLNSGGFRVCQKHENGRIASPGLGIAARKRGQVALQLVISGVGPVGDFSQTLFKSTQPAR